MIEPFPRAVRDYLASFGLGCILVRPDGEVQVARSLAHTSSAAACWWTRDRATAHQVVRAIGAHVPPSLEAAVAELKAAAARCDVVLSEHSVVIARAQTALDQLDRKLETARSAGDLQWFNRAYKQYRLDAQGRGQGFMPYGTAMARLRKLLAAAAAGAQVSDLAAAVFERKSTRIAPTNNA